MSMFSTYLGSRKYKLFQLYDLILRSQEGTVFGSFLTRSRDLVNQGKGGIEQGFNPKRIKSVLLRKVYTNQNEKEIHHLSQLIERKRVIWVAGGER